MNSIIIMNDELRNKLQFMTYSKAVSGFAFPWGIEETHKMPQ